MKKYLIGVAAGLLVLGFVLMGGGWAMGAQTSLTVHFFGYPMNVGIHGISSNGTVETVDGEYKMVSDLDLDAYQDLEIDIGLGDVIFCTADYYGVELEWYDANYALHYTNENGKLKVWSTSTPSVGINMSSGYGGTVTIYLPKGAALNEVDVEADLGDVELWGFEAADLTVVADLGDVSITDVGAEQADLTLNLGNLITSGFTTRKSLTVDADLGNVELCGTYYGTVDVSADLGQVFIDTTLSKAEYRYELDVSLGDIYVDGREMDEHVKKGNGNHSITVYADLGDIELCFG